jgi:hypothetical protein
MCSYTYTRLHTNKDNVGTILNSAQQMSLNSNNKYVCVSPSPIWTNSLVKTRGSKLHIRTTIGTRQLDHKIGICIIVTKAYHSYSYTNAYRDLLERPGRNMFLTNIYADLQISSRRTYTCDDLSQTREDRLRVTPGQCLQIRADTDRFSKFSKRTTYICNMYPLEDAACLNIAYTDNLLSPTQKHRPFYYKVRHSYTLESTEISYLKLGPYWQLRCSNLDYVHLRRAVTDPYPLFKIQQTKHAPYGDTCQNCVNYSMSCKLFCQKRRPVTTQALSKSNPLEEPKKYVPNAIKHVWSSDHDRSDLYHALYTSSTKSCEFFPSSTSKHVHFVKRSGVWRQIKIYLQRVNCTFLYTDMYDVLRISYQLATIRYLQIRLRTHRTLQHVWLKINICYIHRFKAEVWIEVPKLQHVLKAWSDLHFLTYVGMPRHITRIIMHVVPINA